MLNIENLQANYQRVLVILVLPLQMIVMAAIVILVLKLFHGLEQVMTKKRKPQNLPSQASFRA